MFTEKHVLLSGNIQGLKAYNFFLESDKIKGLFCILMIDANGNAVILISLT